MRWCVAGRLMINQLAGSKLAAGVPRIGIERNSPGPGLVPAKNHLAGSKLAPGVPRFRVERRSPGPGLVPAILLAVFAALSAVSSVHGGDWALVVVPDRVELEGNFARAQLLAMRPTDGPRTVPTTNERSEDLTARATYESSDPAVVNVSREGQLLAVGDGEAEITVSVGDATVKVPVIVRGVPD